VLVEARRGGKPGLKLLPPLALCAPDGTDSEEIRRIYHRRT
jgi:tRNA1(Val) A37 N6-methylase TrmN6